MSSDARTTTETDQPWTVGRVIDWTTGHLKKHGSDTPRLDAEILLAHARACPRIQLYTHYDDVLDDEVRASMRALVTRRAQAEPVAYLVGHREFYGLDLHVSSDVLIPRPDTETLVLELLTLAAGRPQPQILELGTGSGCIAVATAANLPAAKIVAVDISPAALNIAVKNATAHNVAERIDFLEGDLFAPLDSEAQFDFVISNPPYIADAELAQLDADVRDHEPHLALAGGADGLDVIRRILAEVGQHLKSGGFLLLEIGSEQGNVLPELIAASGDYCAARIVNDLAHRPRVAVAERL
ncbi:Release factor glutamine methyltransferase [Symmachiella macrocystis]|uniref:Release factor glutamine methyltransferase n=1 Tax=Symmachiella macrocystis TaxID=2527985 RepID=A0A5C6BLC2_9PLAN|nr:peptide chain release factor N(5)-glutamine methyltransferase [Symmachiella macrocystis]TWU12983.1 Release factor glutamine methyltransferase [Symmachiella macrocystis]